MSTPAQIAANRANSQNSTGPTTDTGKQTVSRNSLKFGLTSKVHIALPGEENASKNTSKVTLKPTPRSACPSGIWSAISPKITSGYNALMVSNMLWLHNSFRNNRIISILLPPKPKSGSRKPGN
jgi:hypothetical protein